MSRRRTKAEEIRNPEHYFNRYIACERKKEQEEDTEYYNLHESLDSMILYAAGKLKREDSETKVLPEQRHGEIENLQCALLPVSTQSVESKKVQVNEKSDPLARRSEVEQSEKQGAPSSPETAEIYQRLIGQYSQIVNADCFGTLAQIETKMQQCTAFLENWMTALGNKEFVWSIVK